MKKIKYCAFNEKTEQLIKGEKIMTSGKALRPFLAEQEKVDKDKIVLVKLEVVDSFGLSWETINDIANNIMGNFDTSNLSKEDIDTMYSIVIKNLAFLTCKDDTQD